MAQLLTRFAKHRVKVAAFAAVLGALAGACGGSGGEDPPTPPTRPDADPTADASASGELPFTPVFAQIDAVYKVVDGESSIPAPEELPFQPRTVQARWYRSNGFFVVHYAGLDLEATPPLCPGNSILTPTEFQYVSNAPTEPGACEGATTVLPPPTGVRLCDGKVLYLTAIPVETAGTLYGTVETYSPQAIVGVTSQAPATPSVPEVDLSNCQAPA